MDADTSTCDLELNMMDDTEIKCFDEMHKRNSPNGNG